MAAVVTKAIDIVEAERVIAVLEGNDHYAAANLLRELIPEGATDRSLAGHFASLAGFHMDKALGLTK